MIAVRLVCKSAEAQAFVETVSAALSLEKLDAIVERVAAKVYALLVEKTPKGYTGNLRNQWRMMKPQEAVRVLSNITTVETSRGTVLLLDMLADGTGRYGPQATDVVSPTGALMYIPLNRRAALGWRPGLKYGVDYVMAKSVKGIRRNLSRRPVEVVAPRAERMLEEAITKYLTSVIGV